MMRSFVWLELPTSSLTTISRGYIMRNMNSAGSERDDERGDRVAFVASHLLSRTVLLGQLLVRQVGPRQISRTEASVLDILGDGPRRITELAELAGLAQPTMTLLIRRLEENGWVTRDRLAGDGRVGMVT